MKGRTELSLRTHSAGPESVDGAPPSTFWLFRFSFALVVYTRVCHHVLLVAN